MKLRKKTTWRPYLETLEARRLLSVFADFNGDGFGDLAIGVSGENTNGINAGAVNVIYGSNGGLVATGNQVWTQDSAGIADESELGDSFGWAMAAGDFNGDGFADLAIGVPNEDQVLLQPKTGAVHVIYGSAGGLTATGSQLWNQDSPGIAGFNFGHELFGWALAVGDFDGDGRDDLAAGVPGDLGIAGSVNVIYGSAAGLSATGNKLLSQAGFTNGVAEPTDLFGDALAAGDFNGDGKDDLAIGVPGERVGVLNAAGGVNVIYGSINGLVNTGNQFWAQGSSGIVDQAESGDNFGIVLAAGDFNGDTFADLAVGIPFEDLPSESDAGAVAVIYGRSSGLSAINNQFWTQATPGIEGTFEKNDQFGSGVTAGNFNGDGKDDLAIGVFREDISNIADAGAVHVIYGGPVVLTATGSQLLYQGSNGIADSPEDSDRYGLAVAAGNFNGDTRADLVVGVPQENNAGAVNVFYGTASGLTGTNDQLWSQNSPGILDSSEANDYFGGALSGNAGVSTSGFSGAWKDLTQDCNKQKCKLKGTLEVTNPGLDVAAASVVRFYLSDDATLSIDDFLLQESALKPLAPQQTVKVRLRAKLPKGQSATGKYLIAVLDANNDVFEVNEGNNIVVFGPIA